jgi:hypothetical protein
MSEVWDLTTLFTNDPGGGDWLGRARLAASLSILCSNLAIIRSLLVLYQREDPDPRMPRLMPMLAVLITLGGLSQLAATFGGLPPGRFIPPALTALAAAIWADSAVRIPPALTRLAGSGSGSDGPRDPDPRADQDDKAERLRSKARVLEDLALHDTWFLDKSEALRELRDILADLEAEQCRI